MKFTEKIFEAAKSASNTVFQVCDGRGKVTVVSFRPLRKTESDAVKAAVVLTAPKLRHVRSGRLIDGTYAIEFTR